MGQKPTPVTDGGPFRIAGGFRPAGDQPQAIDELVAGIERGAKTQTLLGVTGSGKTFTMANVIARLGRPALVLSHNKTLAAQLYSEFREFFPQNAVQYFVSYYDYYQPEAYIPQRDIYIEKDSSINEELDRLRLAATSSLISRRDVVIVSSVSCIYGLGSPEDYIKSQIHLQVGKEFDRDKLLLKFVDMLYERSDFDFKRGTFRARGDVVEVWPAYEEFAWRIELFGDEIDQLAIINPTSGEVAEKRDEFYLYPAKHFVMPEDRVKAAAAGITAELAEQLEKFRDEGKILEAQRLAARTRFDVEMLEETGHCQGIENYSRHLTGLPVGHRPNCLLDFFPDDFLVFVDESHVTLPQIRAMYAGDRSRKQTLVDHGFRLPSALDNRPLKFEEWSAITGQTVYVSATPADYELEQCGGEVVEQVIRPTGLVDPVVEVHPATGQVPHLVDQVRATTEAGGRTLVTVLTKRMAEDLAAYLTQKRIDCKWLHSELDAIERVELLQQLRAGEFDCLVGINLLREGLDLPEVALVAIVDADKEGFLRSATSLIQTIGRAARNVDARVILYGDVVTPSMKAAIDETDRRRAKQMAHNREHGITPTTVKKAISSSIREGAIAREVTLKAVGVTDTRKPVTAEYLAEMEAEMLQAAEQMEFERAAKIRDQIKRLRDDPDAGIPADGEDDGRRKKGRRRGKGRQKGFG